MSLTSSRLPYPGTTLDILLHYAGANVNGVTSAKDHSVLSLACAGGHTEVVQLLLAYGADPCQKLKVIIDQ